MELHHDKHHASYVKGANVPLDRLAEARHGGQYNNIAALERALSFNLSGHVLHSIFWQNMAPKAGGRPHGSSPPPSTVTSATSRVSRNRSTLLPRASWARAGPRSSGSRWGRSFSSRRYTTTNRTWRRRALPCSCSTHGNTLSSALLRGPWRCPSPGPYVCSDSSSGGWSWHDFRDAV